MAHYAVGDIQGCYRSLMALLDQFEFNPKTDYLWSVGDLVNRGKDSLKTLEFFCSLGDHAKMVLGNHDLFLLAAYYADWPVHPTATVKETLQSRKAAELMDWLRQKPLIHIDTELGYCMMHAGLYPLWSLEQAKTYADEVHQVLMSDCVDTFLHNMYGNNPNIWSDDLTGDCRLRFIVNAFTRMRYIADHGRLNLHHKGAPENTPEGMTPWFDHPQLTIPSDMTCLFGHWASLGGYIAQDRNIIGLDTGCVWGNQLTAIRLEDRQVFSIDTQEQ